MGALEFRKAILADHLASIVEAADRVVPTHLAELEIFGVPHPPKFMLTSLDLDRHVEEGIFEDPPKAKEETEGEEEEAEEDIPPREPSILDALANDPSDPPVE